MKITGDQYASNFIMMLAPSDLIAARYTPDAGSLVAACSFTASNLPEISTSRIDRGVGNL